MSTQSLNHVVAFIQPMQLDAVVDALRRLPNFPGMTISDVQGFGAHAAHPPREGESTEVFPFRARIRVEIYCRTEELDGIVGGLRRAAHTGHPGDGKVFVGPVTSACRIRTGEEDEQALLPTRPGK